MNPAVQAVICGRRRKQVTLTFTGNATWTAPVTTSRVDAVGNGAAGTSTTVHYTHITTSRYKTAGGIDYVESDTDNNWSDSPSGADYCNPAQPDSGIYYQYIQCFYHRIRTDTTTGQSTTGFGKTFPGGAGGTAATTTFNGITVTPGANYSFVVPTGGSLTITYSQ